MYEMHVEGMSCGGCVAHVKKAIQAVDGAAEINVDLSSKTVRVNTPTDVDAIKAAIVAAGYPVTAVHAI